MARHIVTFKDLVACARRVGVKVVEAPSSRRGKIGEMGTVTGVTCHYTGTSNKLRPTEEYLDFEVVKEGRPGLWNSLSALGLGRWSTIFVFSEDLSWHAGVWSYGGTTDGNGHYLGIEAAGVGDWTPWQRRVYPRLVASLLLFIDEPATSAPTHAMGAMPRGRKVDFTGSALKGFLPDIFPGGRDFHDAVAWLLKNPAYININYKASTTPPTEKQEVLDMANVPQDEWEAVHERLATPMYRDGKRTFVQTVNDIADAAGSARDSAKASSAAAREAADIAARVELQLAQLLERLPAAEG